MIDKDSLPLDKPRRTPDHPTKSHVVKTRVDGKEKIIRFGEQGAKTAGKPKEGESEAMKQKRASFKARHAKNIAKGKSSPAYWADKVKWATGGSVDLEDLDEKYEGIKKPDFTLLESFRQLISDLQARAEESGTQEFDPLRALGRSGAAESLEDLYASYADKPRESHARRAEAGAEPVTEADMGGISAEAQEALAALRASWSGPEFDVISGYRDPERNKRVGGVKGSQHLDGNAFDINTAGWTPEEKLALADAAYDAGFRGFGFYNNNLHFDVASPRAWGPSYKRESVPLWAQDWVAQRFAEGGVAELAHKYDKGGKKKTQLSGSLDYKSGSRDDSRRKRASGSLTLSGDLGSITPGFSYSKDSSHQQFPDGFVVDEFGRQIGLSINGELFLDDSGENKLRAGASKDTMTGGYSETSGEELLGKDAYKKALERYFLGLDIGPLSLDVNKAGDDVSGRAAYRAGDNMEFSVEDSNRGDPTFGFQFAQRFAEGGLAELAHKYDKGGKKKDENRLTALQNARAAAQKQKGLSYTDLLLDNIIGLDNDYLSAGERLGQAFNEDEIEFLKNMGISAYEGVKGAVTSPIETIQGVGDSIYNSGESLLRGLEGKTQELFGVGYDDATPDQVAQAREALVGDVLNVSQLIPGATVARRGAGAVGDTMRAVGRDVVDRLNQPGPMPTTYSNPIPGLRLYHSSPHDFDRFSMSQIGTGEGAQAYGHGLYFAESPSVSGRGGDYWRQFFNRMRSGPERTATGAMYANKFDPEKAAAQLESNVRYHADRAVPGRYGDGPEVEEGNRILAEENQQALDMIKSGKIVGPRTYEVEVNANPEDFLDWDRLLSEQPEVARRIGYSDAARIAADRKKLYGQFSAPESLEFEDLFGPLSAQEKAAAEQLSAMPEPWNQMTGKDAWFRASKRRYVVEGPDGRLGPGADTYEEAVRVAGGDPNKVRTLSDPAAPARAEFMREAGVPGIRYLDAGSRNIGDGSRNYVVFDENLINIVRKYGIAGAAAMLGVSAADVEQAMAQGNVEDLDQKYAEGGKVNTDDELERAILLRDLELMAEERSPNAVPAEDPRLLNVGGIGDRLALINKYLNPVEAIGDAMSAGRDLMASDAGGYDRLEALGRMLSGVASVLPGVGPLVRGSRTAVKAANTAKPSGAVIRQDDTFRGEGPITTSISKATKPYAVRVTGQSQIDDMIQSGMVRPPEGGYAGKPVVYFHEMDEAAPKSVFHTPKSDPGKGYSIVMKSENAAGREGPISLDDLQHIWTLRDGKMVDILDEVRAMNRDFDVQKYAEGGKVNADDELESAIYSREPTVAESVEDWWADKIRRVSGDTPFPLDERDSQRIAKRVANLLSYVPISAGMMSGAQAERDIEAGDYGTAALNAGTALLDVVPIAAATKGGVSAIKSAADDVTELAAKYMSPDDIARFAADESGALRLYHGSPHDFDRFSMSKIGTGEGAQAYGHGLYFAENEGIARGYRDQLSRPYLATSEGQNIAEKYGHDVANIFEMAGGEPDDMRATVVRLRKIVKENLDDIGVADVSQLKSEFYGDLPSTIIHVSNRADRLESLLNSGDVKLVNTGRMYEVEVNANPEDFLDWDKPLSEQPKKVQEVFRPRIEEFRRLGAQIGNDPDGATLEQIAHPTVQLDDVDWSRGLRQQAADYMREAGIPGIKYLDSGSRGAGDGTRNYVIFDENLINIVRKYGIAGAATMLGVSAFDVEQAMAQSGSSQYDPDAIEATAARVRENKFAAGGAVKYDPGAVDRIITKLREVNRG